MAKKADIEITIRGAQGTGKSTIANAIAEMLYENTGVVLRMVDEDGDEGCFEGAIERLHHVPEILVAIETVQE